MTVAGFITAQRADYGVPVAASCRVLGVSPAWYYKWAHGDASPRRARREKLTIEIRRIFAARKGRSGSPRVTDSLRKAGWRVSKNTVARIMAEQHLVARPGRRRRGATRRARGNRWYADDLVRRRFDADAPDRLWFCDGTELVTDEGRLWLYSVLDMFSRRILGFAISEHHDHVVAYQALVMALAARGGAGAIETGRLRCHTDRGTEFTAEHYRTACARIGLHQSMGRPGSALDNSVLESWHSTLELELRALVHWHTRTDARRAVAEFIDEYNQSRQHSSLGMDSPIQYERRHAA